MNITVQETKKLGDQYYKVLETNDNLFLWINSYKCTEILDLHQLELYRMQCSEHIRLELVHRTWANSSTTETNARDAFFLKAAPPLSCCTTGPIRTRLQFSCRFHIYSWKLCGTLCMQTDSLLTSSTASETEAVLLEVNLRGYLGCSLPWRTVQVVDWPSYILFICMMLGPG